MRFSACAARIVLLAALFPLAAAGDALPRPLAARGLDNLAAFTRLLGYVRFFHPSDQAAAADWQALALAGVEIAEPPRTPEELARALEDFFRPVAPTLRVYPTAGPRPPLAAGLTAPAGAPRPEAIHWEHLGVELAANSGIYKSRRVAGTGPLSGQLQQSLEAGTFAGRRVVVRAAARLEAGKGGAAFLQLRSYDKVEAASTLAESSAPAPSDAAAPAGWRTYEVAADVPKDSTGIEIDLGLAGEGRVWWDDVSLEAAGGSGEAASLLANPGFETAQAAAPAGWDFPWDSRRAGYAAALSEDRPKSGRRSVLVSYSPPDPSALPSPEEPLAVDLGAGVSALVPLALYRDAQGKTLPLAAGSPRGAARPAGFVPSGKDRTTRLADVALAWPVFQHFYPYFDVVAADWPAELRRALAAAAADGDETAFRNTLRRMVAALHDGHGGVYLASSEAPGQLPLLWDWVEGELVVTQLAPAGAGELQPGDAVLAIDGRPVGEALAEAESMISGATPQWRRWNAVRRLSWGKLNETVRLAARHPGGASFTVALARSFPPYGPGSLEEKRPEKIAELKPGIFYVDISRIEAADLQGALDRLAGARGIVFDLRGYPTGASLGVISHLTDQPVSSALWNVPVITRPDRQGWHWDLSSWTINPQAPRFRGKAAFLTDGRAISFAETYMGIIEHYHLAEIVGSPTAGTNGNINPFELPGGYRLIWTGMKVLKHDGSQHHGIGILPTLPAVRTIQGVAAGRDEVLAAGIAAVGGG